MRRNLMDPKRLCSRLMRLALVSALVFLGALTVSPPVHATKAFLSEWRSTYPDSTSADNLASACKIIDLPGFDLRR